MMGTRIDLLAGKWSGRLGLLLCGWLLCSGYYGTQHLIRNTATLQKVQAVDIPKLKNAVKCEDARADKTAQIAKQAIAGAWSDSAPIPDPSSIPKDCPHPPIVK